MAPIREDRKFKTTKEQTNPTNPTGNVHQENNKFDIDKKTVKGKQTKH